MWASASGESGWQMKIVVECILAGRAPHFPRLTQAQGLAMLSAESPPIYRCRQCGSLVHPADRGDEHPIGWCQRCQRYVATDRDGG